MSLCLNDARLVFFGKVPYKKKIESKTLSTRFETPQWVIMGRSTTAVLSFMFQIMMMIVQKPQAKPVGILP